MSFIPVSILSFLNEHYKLSEKEISFYTQNKFIKLKQVLNEETISWHFYKSSTSGEKMI
jgi:hypothetical protein